METICYFDETKQTRQCILPKVYLLRHRDTDTDTDTKHGNSKKGNQNTDTVGTRKKKIIYICEYYPQTTKTN